MNSNEFLRMVIVKFFKLIFSKAFNATDHPFKMATFPQYEFPQAKKRYADIATILQLEGRTQNEKIQNLIEEIESLKRILDIPDTLEKIIGSSKKDEYFAAIPHMAEMAFDDQCTAANPRYPLIADLEKIYSDAWYGPPKKIQD